jgi:hypothetical protein
MGIISLQNPQIGQPDTTEDVKIQNNFTTLQTVINGNIDSTNLSAATSQSAGINQSGLTVKGATNIATSQSTVSTTYTTLSTPDQVAGVVLPTNGLIAVWYQATWQESVVGGARAAIFLGANQLKAGGQAAPGVQECGIGAGGPNVNVPLISFWGGVTTTGAGAGSSDVTTGQVVGLSVLSGQLGGPAYIFAAAGTYTVSIQFKVTSGTVTASNRRLWVEALAFS